MKENGYMTIYLALTLGVMISLCLALIEGCRYRGICLETECVMDIGMDSILAEYHRELFAQYNLFAVDCSYGTEHGTTKLTEEHLLEYMNHNFSLEDIFLDKFLYRDFFALEAEKAEMTKAAFVTDGDGEVFRRMAVDAIEDDVGIGLLQQIKEWVKTIKSRGLLERSVEEEKETVDAQIREYDGRETADGKVIHIENPTEAGVDRDLKVKDWTDDQAAKIREIIGAEYKVEGDLRSEVQLNIKRLMDIGCYRGVRHRIGLPVRGQSTKNNARTRKGRKKTVANKKKATK